MKIQRLSEARYTNFQRGSLEWILENFFDDQHDRTSPGGNSTTDVYKIKDDFIAIYINQYIVDLIEIERRDDTIYVYPLVGNAQRYSYRTGDLAEKLIIFRKDRVHPR